MDSTSMQTDQGGDLGSGDGPSIRSNRRRRRAMAAMMGGLAVATVVVLSVSSWGGDDDAPVERLSTSGTETADDGTAVTEPTVGTARPTAPTRASTVASRAAPAAAASSPAITVEPTAVQAGEQEVRVHGRHWAAGSTVNIRLVEPQPARAEFINFDVTADSEGTFLARFIVPADVLPGDYLVEALGSSGGSAIAGLTVAPAPPEVADDGDDGLGAVPCLDDLGQPCDEDCVNDPGLDEGCDPPDGGGSPPGLPPTG